MKTQRDELIHELDLVWMMGEVHLTKARVADFILNREKELNEQIKELKADELIWLEQKSIVEDKVHDLQSKLDEIVKVIEHSGFRGYPAIVAEVLKISKGEL